MKTISNEEILNLYKKCGLNDGSSQSIRTQINRGTLNNKLNTNYSFYNQNSAQTIWSATASIRKNSHI